MDNMEARLRLVEDRFSILDIEAEYAATWDFGDAEGWARVFADDGYFEMLPVGSTPHVVFRGHEELRGFCEQISRNWTGLHYMHPPKLQISGDEANSLILFEFRHAMQGDRGEMRQGTTGGYYKTRYIRTSAGWRIQSRVEQAVFEDLSNSYPLRGLSTK